MIELDVFICVFEICLLLLTCFCLRVLQLITHVLNVLVASLCKPVIHKLKVLGGEKLEYYKAVGGTTKRGEPNFEVTVGEAKGGENDF